MDKNLRPLADIVGGALESLVKDISPTHQAGAVRALGATMISRHATEAEFRALLRDVLRPFGVLTGREREFKALTHCHGVRRVPLGNRRCDQCGMWHAASLVTRRRRR